MKWASAEESQAVNERDVTPTDDDLLAFDRGLLADDATEIVARWLDAHPEGEERLQRLAERSPDQALEALRGPCRIENEMDRLTGVASRFVERMLDASHQPPGMLSAPLPDVIRDYRLLGLLGHGGMSRVFRARHIRLQRDVALKLLPNHLAANPAYRVRFEREMAVVGRLNHPNLVHAHDAGIEGGYLFLVMELLDGQDLGRLVSERGSLSIADACEVVRQAAGGLHYAHQNHTIHRDIKPSNLFLTRAGVVKIIDLGLARAAEPAGGGISSTDTVMGTYEYMAPEQWEAATLGPGTDIYSLGCALFCLLTGKPPFTREGRETWTALLDAHRTKTPPSVCERRADVPPELADLIARMLAKKPAERPASAAELAESLAPFCTRHELPTLVESGRIGLTPAKPIPPATGRRRRRSRWPAIVGALAGVLVLVLALRWGLPLLSGPGDSTPSNERVNTKDSLRPNPPPSFPLVLKPAHTFEKHTGRVLAVAYTAKGDVLASGGEDRTIWLWDPRTGEARGPLLGHPGDVYDLAFSRDGRTLASVTSAPDSCEVRLWDVATAKPAGTPALGGENSGNYCLQYSRDGQILVCGGWDRTVHIFDVAKGTERHNIADVGERFIRTLSISPDGQLIATGGSGATKLWNVSTREEVPSQLPAPLCPTFLPNGKMLAGWSFYAGSVSLCDVSPPNKRIVWRAHPGKIEGLAISADGRFLASCGSDGAKIWRVSDQILVARLEGHDGAVYSAAFTADGKHVATAGYNDHTVRIWDLPEMFHTR
jgi:serine/threonine protein kinase